MRNRLRLLFGCGDVGWATVVGKNDLVLGAVMVVEGDAELVGQSVDDGGADAETGKGAGARHKSNFADVLPGPVILDEFVVNEAKKLLGEIVAGLPLISLVV